MPERARHGDAPKWILWHVVAVIAGLPAAVAVYVGLCVAVRWQDAPSPGPAWSAAVVVALLSLFRAHGRHRPLPHADRTYYRLAVGFIGLWGAMGTWWVGAFVAAAMLVHSYLTDRSTTSAAVDHPVVRGEH